MDSRRRKQLLYGGTLVIIVALIVFGIYFLFLRTTPSCFDHVQDGTETGVDCGGSCASACAPRTLDSITTTGGVQSFMTSPGHYTFLAQVANADPNFGAASFDYAVDLYGGPSSTLVASLSGASFIYAGEVKYLLVPNVLVAEPFTSASMSVAGAAWTPSSTLGAAPQFHNPLAATGNTMTSSTIIVNGALTDSDASAFQNILIIGIFKNASGLVIGASQTELDAIAPGQTENFSVSYPATPDIDPALTQFYAYALR